MERADQKEMRDDLQKSLNCTYLIVNKMAMRTGLFFKSVSKEKFFQLLRHPSIAIPPPAQGACCLTYRGPDRTYFLCPGTNCLFISMMQYVQKPGLCDINGLVRGINRSNPRTVPTPVRTATHPPQVLFYIRAAKSNQKKGRKKQPLVHQLFAC